MVRPLIILLFAAAACRTVNPADDAEGGTSGGGAASGAGGGSTSTGDSSSGSGAGTGDAPGFRLGTWNLHNFSQYGVTEYRVGDIAAKIEELGPDVLAVQELRVQTDSGGEGDQAFDTLLETLEDYQGLHNPWDSFDTTVGLLYDPEVVTVVASRMLFDDDSFAFPRPPLEVDLAVSNGTSTFEVRVIVLHLKAFAADVERRRAACAKLHAYVSEDPDASVVMLGDFNDDPYDAPADNAFTGTFLDGSYGFLTHVLPPESVTSVGFHHVVDGVDLPGEFLDHIVVTHAVTEAYGAPVPVIHGLPSSEFDAWEASYSDHFPVIVDLAPIH